MSSVAIESRRMEERGRLEKFSLLGGPLHRLGRRLGLVRGETNTVALGLALGLLSWSILLALASFGGVSDKLFSLSAIAVDVRLLVVIPLFFLCESSLDPRVKDFVSTIVRSGAVPSNALPALESRTHGPMERRLAAGSNVPVGCCTIIVVCSAAAPVGKNGGARPEQSHERCSLSRLGMGLAICRSIIEAHGGRLWATPNDPRGAVFQFSVPTRQEEAS
jgi:hypothetical protein